MKCRATLYTAIAIWTGCTLVACGEVGLRRGDPTSPLPSAGEGGASARAADPNGAAAATPPRSGSNSAPGEVGVGGPAADSFEALFRRRLVVARRLVEYEHVARVTSDCVYQALLRDPELRHRIGDSWFCFRRGDVWHAVYGKYDEAASHCEVAFHYYLDGDGQPQFTVEPLDEEFLVARARAIRDSRRRLEEQVHDRVPFNPYLLATEGGFEVWYLPSEIPGVGVQHGAFARYAYTASGAPRDDVVECLTQYYAYSPTTTPRVVLDVRSEVAPRVCDLFFALAFGDRFEEVSIRSKARVSRRRATEDGEEWVHEDLGAVPGGE